MKKKKIARIIGGVFACLLIGFLLFLVNSFMGNPISKALATHAVKEYVQEEYPSFNLEVDSATYNFKDGTYYAVAKSNESVDTHFSIHCGWSGNVLDDSYENSVLSGRNTFHRMDEEYQKIVEPLIESNLSYDFDMVIASLDRSKEPLENLPLDMKFDLYNVPGKAYVTVYLYTDDLSWDNTAKTALNLDRFLQENKLAISEYTVVLEPLSEKEENNGESFGIYDFPQELLSSENLAEFMEKRDKQWEQENEKK